MNTIFGTVNAVALAIAAVIGIICAVAVLAVAMVYLGGIVIAVAFVIAVVKGMTP